MLFVELLSDLFRVAEQYQRIQLDDVDVLFSVSFRFSIDDSDLWRVKCQAKLEGNHALADGRLVDCIFFFLALVHRFLVRLL